VVELLQKQLVGVDVAAALVLVVLALAEILPELVDSLPYRKYVPISNKGRLAIRATHGTLPA
jgi:hypothetical protein